MLHVIQGPDRGQRFALPANEPQLIGRSSEALPLTDTTVSRRHAELTPDHGRWWLRDLDSSNGCFVNGQLIDGRVMLSPGDQIRCGSTIFLFARAPEDDRAAMIQMLDGEAFDVTVEGTSSINDESLVLAAPEPLQAALDHLRVIYDLTALTSSTVERSSLLERVVDLIFAEFDPERGFVLLQEGEGGRRIPAVVRYREKPRTLEEGRIPVSNTIVQHTLERMEGILSTNAMNDDRFRSGDSVRDYGIRTAICVPIHAGDRVFGVIHIDSSLANFTYTESQLRLMNAIGQHTGLALLSAERVASELHTARLAAMGQTVASISHSIKNILQGLRGGADAVELALNRDDLDLAKQGWPILKRNLGRILSLTMNMLAYSRPPGLDLDLVPVPALMRDVAELVEPHAKRKQVGLLFDLDADMPPIPLDPNAIHQVLVNLVTNAIDAAPAKKGIVTLAASFSHAAHEATLTVADNGPGIPAEQHDAVFDAFVSSKGQRGTGLGLAVSRKLVEEHGGRIELESAVDAGAVFRVILPSDTRVDPSATELPRPRPTTIDPFDT